MGVSRVRARIPKPTDRRGGMRVNPQARDSEDARRRDPSGSDGSGRRAMCAHDAPLQELDVAQLVPEDMHDLVAQLD
ncbi:hypothetical protein GCM10025862_25570 [Arsenicicoccus piscis]|uniref:Uncharacterized protein n=1 Tax=Arsenicicoccus piscis TaxID=673954 RepID=A0ABQ6HQC8_9MICO|nr:hypothetical protein GCM10025862_25570 [Arsenicicoccus piscis]